MADAPATPSSSASPRLNDTWSKWHTEIELAVKARGAKQWQERGKKIIKRYRDERVDNIDGTSDGMQPGSQFNAKFNILWSNVQTLMPALYARTPKPVVERRYLDRDEIGRTASTILERALLYELDDGCYSQAIRRAVLDRLLPGRGVVWVRYEPRFVKMPEKTQVAVEPELDEVAPETVEGEENEPEQPGAEVEEQVASESVPVDYINWLDFLTSPARTWEEVWWVAKRVYMTRKELVKRFGAVGKDVPLDWIPGESEKAGGAGAAPPTGNTDTQKRARVLEIWDKTERKVLWMAEKWSDQMLDEMDDPLGLEGFWPVPKPLYATITNDSLVPVPDYAEYQDQALELDDLTSRISSITKAIKAAGIYDASIPELQRMFEEGFENRLVPADSMAEFSQKAGPTGMGVIWMLPVKDLAFVLLQLYQARDQVKQSLYEVTGISDIVRGQAASGGAKTATEQRIKGQFASMRLNDMQADVARFCRDTLCIMGEVIAEHYDPMTLFLVSGFEQYAKEQWPPQSAPQAPPGMPPGGPQMGAGAPGAPQGIPNMGGAAPPPVGAAGGGPVHPPAPGMLPMGMPPGMMPPPMDPATAARMKASQIFQAAVALLRSDKLRGFKIEIETDSLIEPDQQETQRSRTELMAALSQFLPQAVAAGQQMPTMIPLLARLVMFGVRGFKASRDIESALEQFTDDMTKQAANPAPKPPSPEQMKAQAETAKSQAAIAKTQEDAKIAAGKAQAEAALAAQKHQQDMERLAAEAALRDKELMLAEAQLKLKERETLIGAIATEHQAALDTEAREHQHAMKMTEKNGSGGE